jgi:hypothetical protein
MTTRLLATLVQSTAVAMGTLARRTTVVRAWVHRRSDQPSMLMVVSLHDPQNPVGLGYVTIDDAGVGDVILKDDLALLGGSRQVTLVSLTDKTHPRILGTAPGVGG